MYQSLRDEIEEMFAELSNPDWEAMAFTPRNVLREERKAAERACAKQTQRLRHVARGECRECGAEAVPGRRSCVHHLLKAVKRAQLSREAREERETGPSPQLSLFAWAEERKKPSTKQVECGASEVQEVA